MFHSKLLTMGKFFKSFDKYLYIVISLCAIGSVIIFCLSTSSQDLVSNLVLWITAMIVLAYTIETAMLRTVSNSQLSISSKALQNDMLPVLMIVPQCVLQDDRLHLVLKNIGKGPAREIRVNLEGNTLYEGLMLLPDEQRMLVGTPSGYGKTLKDLTNDKQREQINMSITYFDMYERRIDINGIVLSKDADISGNRFVMEEGKWKFLFHE